MWKSWSATYKNAELGIATHSGDLVKVQDWIRRGANVNCSDGTEGTLLHVACRLGSLPLVEILLASGASVNATAFGHQPLHIAAERGDVGIVQYLLEHGADVRARRQEDRATPLHLACQYNRVAVVETLLMRLGRAGVNAVNANGETPLFVACFHGGADVAKCLASRFDVTIQYRSRAGWTPLHAACRSGLLELVRAKWMRDAFDVNVTESQGWTGLHVACYCQQLRVVQYLMEHTQANATALTNDGFSPFDLACQPSTELDVTYYLVREHRLWDRFF